jgi:adenosine kinase
MATAGRDFDAYAQWMAKTGVPRDYVRIIETEHTAQAFITTDRDDNQITAFHPGAMQHAHVNRVSEARDIAIGIVAPDGRQGMIEHAAEFAAQGIPFIFDPGQGLPMFEAPDLVRFISQATWVTVNDYEWQLMQQKTGWSVREVLAKARALIVTRGAEGSVIHTPEGELAIPCASPRAVVDPTGCGDAYRAGLIHGLMHGLDWPVTGRIASLMGALKIEVRGTQNHRFTAQEFAERFRESFAMPLPASRTPQKLARAQSGAA